MLHTSFLRFETPEIMHKIKTYQKRVLTQIQTFYIAAEFKWKPKTPVKSEPIGHIPDNQTVYCAN